MAVDLEPPLPGAVEIELPGGAPDPLAPGVPTTFPVTVGAEGEQVVAGSPVLYHRYRPVAFTRTPLVPLGGDQYEATLPVPECGDAPEFYLTARGTITGCTITLNTLAGVEGLRLLIRGNTIFNNFGGNNLATLSTVIENHQ